MRTRRRTAVLATLAFAAAWAGSANATEKPEELVVQKMPPWHLARGHIVDISMPSMTDGRIYAYDADVKKLLGRSTASAPASRFRPTTRRVSSRRPTSRGSHGTRTDRRRRDDRQHDARSCGRDRDSRQSMRMCCRRTTPRSARTGGCTSRTSRRPASTVIDAVSKQVLSEIDTAACVLAYVGQRPLHRVVRKRQGVDRHARCERKEAKRTMSEAFIDVDKDPASERVALPGRLSVHDVWRQRAQRGFQRRQARVRGRFDGCRARRGWRPGACSRRPCRPGKTATTCWMHKGGDGRMIPARSVV